MLYFKNNSQSSIIVMTYQMIQKRYISQIFLPQIICSLI